MSPRTWLRVGLWGALSGGVIGISTFLLLDWLRPGDVSIGPATNGEIVVTIDGAVATPGILSLPAGARLHTAIDAVGGLTGDADTTGLNMAGRLADGEHIAIPSIRVMASPGVDGATPVSPGDPGLININTADVAELDQLPGIGPVIAQRIVDFREFYGDFDSVDQLEEIEGISPAMVDEIRSMVTVDD